MSRSSSDRVWGGLSRAGWDDERVTALAAQLKEMNADLRKALDSPAALDDREMNTVRDPKVSVRA